MFKSIGIVISWLPTIVATITAVEHILGAGNGSEKKRVVLDAIYRVFDKAGVNISGPLRAVLSSVIDAIVAVLNLLGVAGFSDYDDQDALDLVPASYIHEVDEDIYEDEILADPLAAFPENDDRLEELEGLLRE